MGLYHIVKYFKLKDILVSNKLLCVKLLPLMPIETSIGKVPIRGRLEFIPNPKLAGFLNPKPMKVRVYKSGQIIVHCHMDSNFHWLWN